MINLQQGIIVSFWYVFMPSGLSCLMVKYFKYGQVFMKKKYGDDKLTCLNYKCLETWVSEVINIKSSLCCRGSFLSAIKFNFQVGQRDVGVCVSHWLDLDAPHFLIYVIGGNNHIQSTA